jgi:hypothetical protein
MERKFKKGRIMETTRRPKKVGEKPTRPVDKVNFLLHLNKLQGTLLLQLRKEV